QRAASLNEDEFGTDDEGVSGNFVFPLDAREDRRKRGGEQQERRRIDLSHKEQKISTFDAPLCAGTHRPDVSRTSSSIDRRFWQSVSTVMPVSEFGCCYVSVLLLNPPSLVFCYL
ncbi:hypothetical protein K0M31_015002, partial [Melipona bicolor]